jgi:hypothetical protein
MQARRTQEDPRLQKAGKSKIMCQIGLGLHMTKELAITTGSDKTTSPGGNDEKDQKGGTRVCLWVPLARVEQGRLQAINLNSS